MREQRVKELTWVRFREGVFVQQVPAKKIQENKSRRYTAKAENLVKNTLPFALYTINMSLHCDYNL